MSDPIIPTNSLVLYRTRPARVAAAAGDKLTLELEGGETARVRPKDVTLLHVGPLRSLADVWIAPVAEDLEAAWELLAGSATTIREIAELAYGEFTPAAAWAAWQRVTDGLYFRAAAETLRAASAEEVAQTREQRAAEAAERQAWEGFLVRARQGTVGPEDRRYLREVEDLAFGRVERSRVLRALGREESPINAHAALLEWGAWDAHVNPYPVREGLNLSVPDLPLSPEWSALLADPARVDLTHLPAYAVDDIRTDTPDDALSWEPGGGLGKVWVHVADPASAIRPDDPVDLEARSRGTTLHLPEGTVPMLPPATIPLLGLGLDEFSPALSFGISVDDESRITGVEIVPSIVRVARLTYEEASERIGEPPFDALERVAAAFEARRMASGAVAIDLPETQVYVDGGRIDVVPVRTSAGRTMVENCMILAGEAVARYALDHGIPVPFATQEAPDAARPGALPGESATDAMPAATLAGMAALRRRMKRAQYRSIPAEHSGLGLPAYSQATSPLRRYLDLVVHQQLRAHLSGQALLDTTGIIERIGEVEGPLGAARRAEAQSDKHWTLVYLDAHPGQQWRGVLVDRRGASGNFVVPDLALETQVHLSADLALNTEAWLVLRSVDLPHLDARFRTEHIIEHE